MFQKLLIANRGEIAVRVARACRHLGVSPVAIYSEADRDALHVRVCDEAWPCGPARATESYLSIEAVLEAARRAGVDAVHPGYGFLSENGDFADACAEAGLAFVGSGGDTLRAMGDKVTSRRIAREAGVEPVPGSSEALDDAAAAAFAREIGLPVLVKASGGGGGRGLRAVHDEGELAAAIERARSEAAASFGSDALYVEKLIQRPRHIEVQVLADAHGNALHLFERDCSVQRRHQKLIEECPAPGLSGALREALGEAALRLVRHTGYVGAGTVEFLLDAAPGAPADAFYFLEMNTRIQVEHPVTEMVTGVDLVAWQIRIAAGEKLSLRQEELALRGHAIEARVYAEDPDRGFLPSPGRVMVFRPPGGPGIRVDLGVAAGDTITPHYDAMIAKLVAHGGDREQALARLDAALAEFAVAGVRTTIPFHRRALATDAFRAGGVDTGFVAEHTAGGKGETLPPDERLRGVAAGLAAWGRAEGEARLTVTPRKGEPVEVALAPREDGSCEIVAGDVAFEASGALGRGYSVRVDGQQLEALVGVSKKGRYEVRVAGRAFEID